MIQASFASKPKALSVCILAPSSTLKGVKSKSAQYVRSALVDPEFDKGSLPDSVYGDEEDKVAYKGAGGSRAAALRTAAFRRGRGAQPAGGAAGGNARLAVRGGSKGRGRGKRASAGGDDSSGGESGGGAYGSGLDVASNGNGARGSRRRASSQRADSGAAQAARRGASSAAGRGRGVPGGRNRGRIGRGLSQAAEALLGMGGEYDQDEAMTVCSVPTFCMLRSSRMRSTLSGGNAFQGRALNTHASVNGSSMMSRLHAARAFPAIMMSLRIKWCHHRVQDVVISEDDEGMYGAAEPASPYPSGSFRPGRVIWAKVKSCTAQPRLNRAKQENTRCQRSNTKSQLACYG